MEGRIMRNIPCFCKGMLYLLPVLLILFGTTVPASAYDVSGTINYIGSKSGRIHILLDGSIRLGTSIPSPGAFTIRGASNGTYSIKAYMETAGSPIQHASSPVNAVYVVTVSNADVTDVNITMADPSPVTPVAPSWLKVWPGDGGVLALWNGPEQNWVQVADSYSVYWSTSPSFTPATAAGNRLNIPASETNLLIQGGLTNGTNLYFLVTAKSGSNVSAPSAITGPITIGTPSGGYNVTGTVTFTNFTTTNPLYILISDDFNNRGYMKRISSPSSPVNFTVPDVANGSYTVYALADRNNNGIYDLGDVINSDPKTMITVNNGAVTVPAITLTNANANVYTQTSHTREGSFDYYWLNLWGKRGGKLPVRMVLTGGPAGVQYPSDIYYSSSDNDFEIDFSCGRPSLSDIYTFTVTYSDGTGENLQAPVTAIVDTFPVPVSPVGNIIGTTPVFSWNAPAPLPSFPYTYTIWVNDAHWNVHNLPSSQTSVLYNFDKSADQATLDIGVNYQWQIGVRDQYGNMGEVRSSFYITGAGITFSGYVTDLSNSPIEGAKIEMVDNPNLWTLSDSSGHFSLSGLPSATTFNVKVSKDGYLSNFTPYLNLTSDLTLPSSIVLFTPAQTTGWGPSAKGFIAAKIMNESFTAMLSGAVVTATGANGTSYPVTYWDGGSNWRNTYTYANGVAIVKNVTAGDTITLQVTSHESSYAQILPIHANAESGAMLSGKVISPKSGNISILPASKDFGNVGVGGSSATQTFTLTNNGPGNLTVLSSYWIGDTSQFTPSLGTCPTTWPFTFTPGESCDLAGAFTPKSVGVKRLTFVINSSANNTPVFNLPMSGTGVTPYNLTINISGGGTVNNYTTVSPAFTPCSQPSCTYHYGAGSVFDLGATPGESFTGWSGTGSASACSGTGHCQFTLNGNSTVTAPFTPRVKIHGNATPYQWLKNAYDAASNNAQIDARNMTFSENLNINGGINVTLKGGLGADFNTVSGYSYLQGILTLGTGSLTVENLCIK
jgi:hypothetical protein